MLIALNAEHEIYAAEPAETPHAYLPRDVAAGVWL
jgi:hypothetical protein